MMRRGLYIHLPFCAQKCGYCDFVITLDRREVFRRRFFEALGCEIQKAREDYGRLEFDTFYLGGGTPSLLNVDEMAEVFQSVRRFFEIKPGAEITCEFNPGDADYEKIQAFRELGVNRVSLGVQAFQDHLLQSAGRKHTVRDTLETIEILQRAGIMNLSFDLIAGLPGHRIEDFKESLNQTIQLGAKQLSYYDLEIHENTPWGIEHEKKGLDLLDDSRRADFFQLAVDLMTGAGFVQYEISTFAKPGFESQHNLLYWQNQEYLGLGPGAYSYLNQKRYQFASNVVRYLHKCEAGDWQPDQCEALTPEQKETEALITAFRLPSGVLLDQYPNLQSRLEPRIAELAASGLVKLSGRHASLTARGRALVESVFRYLLA